VPKRSRKRGADKRRVLLVCAQPLLGEGLESILGGLADVELIGPLYLEARWPARLPRDAPDVVLIAGDELGQTYAAQILDHYPEVPVIRVGLEQDEVRIYTTHTLPARSADLMETIRNLPIQRPRSGEGSVRASDGIPAVRKQE